MSLFTKYDMDLQGLVVLTVLAALGLVALIVWALFKFMPMLLKIKICRKYVDQIKAKI